MQAIHSRNTRLKQSRDYFLPRINKKFSQNLLAFRGAKLCTRINKRFKTLSLHAFETKIKKELIKQS